MVKVGVLAASAASAGGGLGPFVPQAEVLTLPFLFRDTEQHPLLVVCGSGSNGAMFFALWRVLDHQMPFDDAREEALRVGMQPGPIAAYLKEQAERLSEKEGE